MRMNIVSFFGILLLGFDVTHFFTHSAGHSPWVTLLFAAIGLGCDWGARHLDALTYERKESEAIFPA